jgi:hypothetical protein
MELFSDKWNQQRVGSDQNDDTSKGDVRFSQVEVTKGTYFKGLGSVVVIKKDVNICKNT